MERLVLPPNLDSLEPIGQYVLAAAEAAGLDRKAAYRLRLAADELATNIISYGYKRSGAEGTIDVWADLDDKQLTVSIEDTAPSFDPTKVPVPDTLDDPLEDRPIGGLGVFLAMRAVDELRYEQVDGRNRTILVINRTTTNPTNPN